MSIDQVLDLHKKQSQKQKLINELKENPYESAVFQKMVLDSDLDNKEKTNLINQIPDLKKQGLLMDNVPVTLEMFTERNKQNKPDHMVMPLSIYKNLSGDDFHIAQSVKLSFYDDIGVGQQGKIVHYQDEYGLQNTWNGTERPIGARVEKLDLKKADNLEKFNNARKNYLDTMSAWNRKKNTILQDKGKTLQEWFPLPQSVTDRINANNEKMKQEAYKDYLKQTARKQPLPALSIAEAKRRNNI